MTPNLIELIVQAVKDAAHTRNYIAGISITEDQLRTALASIPEMPQVDLGEVEKFVYDYAGLLKSHASKSNVYLSLSDEITNIRKRIGYSLSDLPLTSPPTKTE